MSITLSYGNTPSDPDQILKGEQIRTDALLQAVRMQNEMWAGSGLNLGGIAWTKTLTTTSTSYGGGAGHDFLITQWQPSFKVNMRNSNSDQVTFYLRVYGRNMNVRCRIYDLNGTQINLNTAIATSNTFAWTGLNFVLTGMNTSDTRFIVLDVARGTFDTSAELAQVSAILRPSAANQIPNQ